MRISIAAILLLFACFAAGADTPSARRACTCTVTFPSTKSAEVARQFKGVTCHCAVSDPPDIEQSPIKVEAHDPPAGHSGSAVTVAILALALVTGSQALYTAKLWKSARRLADDGQAAAHRQLR